MTMKNKFNVGRILPKYFTCYKFNSNNLVIDTWINGLFKNSQTTYVFVAVMISWSDLAAFWLHTARPLNGNCGARRHVSRYRRHSSDCGEGTSGLGRTRSRYRDRRRIFFLLHQKNVHFRLILFFHANSDRRLIAALHPTEKRKTFPYVTRSTTPCGVAS